MAVDTTQWDLAALGLRSSTDAAAQGTQKSELGQEDFLRLMITQFQHQDPFKPLENGEFLGQLAQFSSVAGLSNLQRSFADLSAALMSNQTLQASSLLGRTVLVESATGALPEAGSLEGAVELKASAQSVVLQISDASGAVVRQLHLGTQPAGLAHFSWDGTMDNGTPAPAGRYNISAQVVNEGKPTAASVLVEANVESVTMGSGTTGLTLSLKGLGEVPVGSVRKIS